MPSFFAARLPRSSVLASEPRIVRPSASFRVSGPARLGRGRGAFPHRGVERLNAARGSLARAKLNSARRLTEVRGGPEGLPWRFRGEGAALYPTDALLTAGVWDQTGFDVLLAVQAQSAERRWGLTSRPGAAPVSGRNHLLEGSPVVQRRAWRTKSGSERRCGKSSPSVPPPLLRLRASFVPAYCKDKLMDRIDASKDQLDFKTALILTALASVCLWPAVGELTSAIVQYLKPYSQ
jgi:hypothetical protein